MSDPLTKDQKRGDAVGRLLRTIAPCHRPLIIDALSEVEFREHPNNFFPAAPLGQQRPTPAIAGTENKEPEMINTGLKTDKSSTSSETKKSVSNGARGLPKRVKKLNGAWSPRRGVVKSTAAGRPWGCSVYVNGKTQWYGSFVTEEEAARKHDEVARIVHGKKAILNFPDTVPAPAPAVPPKAVRVKTSPFFGVSKLGENTFKAGVTISSRNYIHLGTFTDEIEAARAVDAKLREVGRMDKLNFPDEQPIAPIVENAPLTIVEAAVIEGTITPPEASGLLRRIWKGIASLA